MEISKKNPASDYESEMQSHKNHRRNNNTKKNKKKKTLIQVDKNYRLGADSRSWQILERVENSEKWRAIKWYSNLNNALNGLVNFKLRVSGVETFEALQKEQEKVLKELSEVLLAYMEVV